MIRNYIGGELKPKEKSLWLRFRNDKKGEIMIETIFKLLVFICLLMSIVHVTGIFVKYQNLSHMTKSIVRTIELEGEFGSESEQVYNKLNNAYGLDSTFEISNVTYFDYITKKIQLREYFTITCRANYDLKILSPAARDPIIISIPLKVAVTGMSEVFWK